MYPDFSMPRHTVSVRTKFLSRSGHKFSFTAVLSEATPAEAAHHRSGWVHEAVLADTAELSGCEVYAAGPPAMIEAIRSVFPNHGLTPGRLHFDSFDYAPARP